jgi:hypothetical protein
MNFNEKSPPTLRKHASVEDLAQAWGVSKNAIRDAFKTQGLTNCSIARCRSSAQKSSKKFGNRTSPRDGSNHIGESD